MSTPEVPISGYVDPAFENVRQAFAENWQPEQSDPGDLGAGLTVIAGGRVVVDLVGGWVDRGKSKEWTDRTLVNSYSTFKPLVAIIALQAVANGILDLDDPLSKVWPEIGENRYGVERLTLRQVLSHQSGLPAIHHEVEPDTIYSWDAMCDALASSEPWWLPGEDHGYHVNTFGFLAGEPIARATERSFSQVFTETFAQERGLDLHVGVELSEHARIAEIVAPFANDKFEPEELFPGSSEAERLTRSAYANPVGASGLGIVNTERWRSAAVPSTNGHGTAAGLAAVFADLLPTSTNPWLPNSLLSEALTTHSEGLDRVLQKDSRFGLGFMLPINDRPIGISSASFGHFGFGGSLGFADPDAEIAVGYLINQPGDRWRNPRVKRLIAALETVL